MGQCADCGAALTRAGRYQVRIEVFADAEPLEIDLEALGSDLGAELEHVAGRLAEMTPEEAQDGVHREFRFELCGRCQRRFLGRPLTSAARLVGSQGAHDEEPA